MKPTTMEMRASDVVAIVASLESGGIRVWLDGGWGVDALLGRETRTHGDLDIAVEHEDVPKLRALLYDRGYRDVSRADTTEWNFVIGDDAGHEIDVHSFTLDAQGNCVYGVEYRAGSLTGTGSVAGRTVKCIAAEHAVRFRAHDEPRATDIQDVEALHRRFGIPIPLEHEEWRKRNRR